jgi:hypothetical protein
MNKSLGYHSTNSYHVSALVLIRELVLVHTLLSGIFVGEDQFRPHLIEFGFSK